jgi:hypothetical protein
MTATNFLLRQRRNELFAFSDGAVYGYEDGILSGVSTKIEALPKLSAIIAARGACYSSNVLAREFSLRCDDFDDLLGKVEDLYPKIMDHFAEELFGGQKEGQLFIGGWSHKRNQPELYFLTNTDLHLQERGNESRGGGPLYRPEPGRLQEMNGAVNVISLRDGDMEKGFARPPKSTDDIADVEQYALTVLELQREQNTVGSGNDAYMVGGLAQLVTLTKDKIETRVIHRYADEIGQPIPVPKTDWAAWRARQARGGSVTALPDLSGLGPAARDLAIRKAKKAARRVGAR